MQPDPNIVAAVSEVLTRRQWWIEGMRGYRDGQRIRIDRTTAKMGGVRPGLTLDADHDTLWLLLGVLIELRASFSVNCHGVSHATIGEHTYTGEGGFRASILGAILWADRVTTKPKKEKRHATA